MLATTSRLVLANASSLPHGADPTRDCDARCLAAAGHGHDGTHRLSASRSQDAPGRSRPCYCCYTVFSPMSLRKTLSWTSWESPSAPRAALSCPRVVKGHAPTELRHWNGGRDPPQPPSGSSNGENAQKEGETSGGGQWRRLLVRSTNRSRSRLFARLFFFSCVTSAHHISALPWGDLAKTGVAFFRRPSKRFLLDRRLAAASSGRRVAVRRSALCLAPLPRCVKGP